jgi:flagellin
MTDITFASGSALTGIDPRAGEAVSLAGLARAVRSGPAVDIAAPGFSVVSDRISVARSAQFAADVAAASSATANATHAASLLGVALDALSTIADKLDTLSGLADDAADTTLSGQDRARLDQQFQAVKGEIDDIAAGTRFDGINLLSGNGSGGALQIDYQVGIGASDANRIRVEIGDASTSGLSASLASADITTAASAASASDAISDAQTALGAIQGQVAGDLTRVGTAYLAAQDQAAVSENARAALVDPAIAADLAQRTADQVKTQSRLPLTADTDRKLLHLLTRLDKAAPAAATTTRNDTMSSAPAAPDPKPQPLTPEPAAATKGNDG